MTVWCFITLHATMPFDHYQMSAYTSLCISGFVLIRLDLGRWVCDHPKEGLAKFGCMLEMKVKRFRNHVTCWPHARY